MPTWGDTTHAQKGSKLGEDIGETFILSFVPKEEAGEGAAGS